MTLLDYEIQKIKRTTNTGELEELIKKLAMEILKTKWSNVLHRKALAELMHRADHPIVTINTQLCMIKAAALEEANVSLPIAELKEDTNNWRVVFYNYSTKKIGQDELLDFLFEVFCKSPLEEDKE